MKIFSDLESLRASCQGILEEKPTGVTVLDESALEGRWTDGETCLELSQGALWTWPARDPSARRRSGSTATSRPTPAGPAISANTRPGKRPITER